MKLRILAVAAALALVTTTAAAGTNKLKGKFKSDGNSSVSLKVDTKMQRPFPGAKKVLAPVRIRSLTIKRVAYVCEKGRTGQLSAKLGKLRVGNQPLAGYLAQINKTVKGVTYSGFINVRSKGRRVTGLIGLSFRNGGDDDDVCRQKSEAVPNFSAKVKR